MYNSLPSTQPGDASRVSSQLKYKCKDMSAHRNTANAYFWGEVAQFKGFHVSKTFSVAFNTQKSFLTCFCNRKNSVKSPLQEVILKDFG